MPSTELLLVLHLAWIHLNNSIPLPVDVGGQFESLPATKPFNFKVLKALYHNCGAIRHVSGRFYHYKLSIWFGCAHAACCVLLSVGKSTIGNETLQWDMNLLTFQQYLMSVASG